MKDRDENYWFVVWATVGLWIVVLSFWFFPEVTEVVLLGWIYFLFGGP